MLEKTVNSTTTSLNEPIQIDPNFLTWISDSIIVIVLINGESILPENKVLNFLILLI